jgi:transmembrane sensor
MQHKRGNFKNYVRRLSRKKASALEKKTFARWFNQLDLSDNVLADGEEGAIQEKVRQALQNHAFNTRPQPAIIYSQFWLRSAAAVLLIFMGSAFYFLLKRPSPRQLVASREIHTLKGERKTITLEDGTIIQLNNESSLTYPENFSGNTREVYLKGEAFFQVTHNPAKPFRVHVETLNVEDLGTKFDIKAYPEDNAVSVTVAAGKVGVNKPGAKETFLLTPGDRLSYYKLSGKVTQKKVDVLDETAWQQGELVFRDENLGVICNCLERWYNVNMRIRSKSLTDKKLSLKIKGDDFNSVLKMLSLAGDFNYYIKGKTVVLTR